MNTYNLVQFAKLAGMAVKTFQRWDREGRQHERLVIDDFTPRSN
jgi:predicted site-specific integrase-resolvase